MMSPVWRSGVVVTMAVAVVLAACVPTPGSRLTPAVGAAGEAAGSAGTALETPAVTASAAGGTTTPSFVRPTPNPSPTFLVYEVRGGDTLTSIARQFGTTARSIAYWNRARYPSLDPDSTAYEPDRIVVGWTLLLIPTAVVDEDDLPEQTPTPTSASPRPGPSTSPS